jgi:hypothetical protein
MTTRKWPPRDIDLDAQAQTALDEARAMPPGPEKTEALCKAGMLRNAADVNGFIFAKRGRPRKNWRDERVTLFADVWPVEIPVFWVR